MNLNDYLTTITADIEAELERLLPSVSEPAGLLAEAMRYSVFNGGKRLRPALFCSTILAFEKNYRLYLPYAAAIEMIHCYSLIHDDLPAMDDDDLRRGKPTCHIVYGEAMAILAGDALLTRAGEILAKPIKEIPAANQLEAVGEILSNAGHMVRGQAIELTPREKEMDLEILQQIYAGKTAALFRAAVVGAACLVGATKQQKAALSEYCAALGMAFQIADDILDIQGDQALVGKPIGSDEKNDKATYAAIMGCDAAQKIAEDLAQKAISSLEMFGQSADNLRLYPTYFVARDM